MTTIRSWRHRAISLVGAAALVTAGLALATMAKPTTAHADTPVHNGGDFISRPAGSRVLDTRAGIGTTVNTKIPAGGKLDFQVLGQAGVPTTGVEAVLFNVWAISPTAHTSFTLYPTGTPFPGTSSSNSPTASGSYNASVLSATGTAPGSEGMVTFYNGASVAIDTIVDVEGYYATNSGSPASGGYVSLDTTHRVVDTRTGTGAAKAKIPANGSLTVNVGSILPANTVQAYGEIFIANSTGAGYLSQHVTGATDNAIGLIGFQSGDGTSTSEVLQLGADGKDVFVNHSNGSLDIAIDIAGYFSSTAQGADLHPRQDRLAANVPIAAAGSTTIKIANNNGMPTSGMTLAALNFTLSGQTAGGYVQVSTDGGTWVANTDLSTAGQYRNSLLMVPITSTGTITVKNMSSAALSVWVDAEGFYTSTPYSSVSLAATSAPALIQALNNVGVDGAFISSDGTLYHGTTSNATDLTSATWSAVNSTHGDALTGSPNLAKNKDHVNLLLAVLHQSDGEVLTASLPYGGDWSSAVLTRTGGIMAAAPVSGNLPNGDLVTFDVDAQHNMWALTGTQWTNLGQSNMVGSLVAVNVSDGIEIYGRTISNSVEVAKYNGTLSLWTDLNQPSTTAVSAAAVGSQIRLVATRSDGSVVTELQNSSGSLAASWTTIPALSGAPGVDGAAAAGYDAATSKAFVFERLTDGSLLESVETATGSGQFGTPVQLGSSASTDVAVSPIVGNNNGYRALGFFIDGVGSEQLIHP